MLLLFRASFAAALACLIAAVSSLASAQQSAPRYLAFTFANDRVGWAGGGQGIAMTVDGGHRWMSQYTGARVDQVILVRRHALIALAQGTVLRSSDDGAHWAVAGRPRPALTHIAFATPRDGLGIGTDQLLYATSDGALSWHRVGFDKPVDAVCYTDPSHAYAGGAGTAPALGAFDGIAASSDGGASWNVAAKPPTDEFIGIVHHQLHCTRDAVFDLIDLGAQPGGDAYLFARSIDGARRWTTLATGGSAQREHDVAQGPGTEATGMSAYSADVALVSGFCGACRPTVESAVGGTADGGRTWHETSLGPIGVTSEPVFVTRDHGWLGARKLGANGNPTADEVLETRDGGRTWNTVSVAADSVGGANER